jgi:hypothetical protein
MKDVILTRSSLNEDGYWVNSISNTNYIPTSADVDLFDQNGYDLTFIEIMYAIFNSGFYTSHRGHRYALKQDWFVQSKEKLQGALLNHSLLFERKAYKGEALSQLQQWSNKLPILYKIISMRPKWGLDFSMDWVDSSGNAFEILHWEYDGVNYDEITTAKYQFEKIIQSIDWDDAGESLLKQKNKWHHLDFFSQSDWKCNFFGVEKERFKMVIWN